MLLEVALLRVMIDLAPQYHSVVVVHELIFLALEVAQQYLLLEALEPYLLLELLL